jgi:hypothetical protein
MDSPAPSSCTSVSTEDSLFEVTLNQRRDALARRAHATSCHSPPSSNGETISNETSYQDPFTLIPVLMLQRMVLTMFQTGNMLFRRKCYFERKSIV